MTEKATSKAGGLAGISAGSTAICTVGKEGVGLTYRGYTIEDLAELSTFEEVAYLLLKGTLPTRAELTGFQNRLRNYRELPDSLRNLLHSIPSSAHPMDVLRTATSYLGCIEPERIGENTDYVSERLLALLPTALAYWYRVAHPSFASGEPILKSNSDSIAGHFLTLLFGREPESIHERMFDVSLILYAEHEFNASTFAARVCTATLSDYHSAITAAIGTLRGPLHGGANEEAMRLIAQFGDPNEAEIGLRKMLSEKKLVMGFGHRVYKHEDPRSTIIKRWSKRLADFHGDRVLFPVSERIEQVMLQEKKLFTNLDFYSASAYHFAGIPTELFTPLFVLSRVSGWTAHIFEQRQNNRLIRPSADYVGPEPRMFTKIDLRSEG